MKNYSDSTKKFSETDIIQMFDLVIDNIFPMFSGHVLQQTINILMGSNLEPLFSYLILYSYEATFIQGLLNQNRKNLARSFNFTFCVIDVFFH